MLLPIISYFRKYLDGHERTDFIFYVNTEQGACDLNAFGQTIGNLFSFLFIFGASILAASTRTFKTISSVAYSWMDSNWSAKRVYAKR